MAKLSHPNIVSVFDFGQTTEGHSLLLQEAFRHCKVLAAWGDGTAVLEAAGITAGAAGVVTGETAAKSFTDQLAAAVGLHRAWDRAPEVMASAVPPVLTS